MVHIDSSNDLTDKRNTSHMLINDHIEVYENANAVDIEAINVLSDIISSLSSDENGSLHYSVEVKPEGIAEQATEIVKDSTSENSISAKIADYKEDEMRESLSDHLPSHSNVVLHEYGETNSEELLNKACTFKVTDEMDRIAEQYAEMEEYLDSCVTNDTSPDISKEPCLTSETEVSSIFSSKKATKWEMITLEETDRKSLSREVDSGRNFRSSSESFNLEEETDRGVRDAVMARIVKDATIEHDVASFTTTNDQLVDEIPHDTLVATKDSVSSDAQKNVDVCIDGSTTSPPLSCCMQSSIRADDAKETISSFEKSEDENERERRGNDNEGEQQPDLIENSIDHSVSECEILGPVVDEAQTISVVSSTYDISHDSGVKYLTESERQLGKKKPIWIDDRETLSCMLCCIKFTVFVRRHHCRCCGRVLCARCTTQKASLSYVNNPKKEHRVCDPCFETLQRIEEFEKNIKTGELADMNEYGHSSDISPVTKPVLKSRGKPENTISTNNECSSSNDTAHGGSAVKRSVTFRDGLHPGYSSNATESSVTDMGSSKPKKHDSRRQHISRRLLQLHVADECVCLLSGDGLASDADETATADNQRRTALYLRSKDGIIKECDNIQEQITSLKNFELLEVMIFRNLWCSIKLCQYENKTVMCIISSGMSFVGLDEIFLAYYCDTELIELPIDYLWRIYEIYQNALVPRNESSEEELGIRLAHKRIPTLNRTVRFSNSDKPVARDILLFRPSVQTFANLLVPSSSFLVATFIYQSESIWANVIPQRLLFRLGLQASFYPTSIINDFNREPVYNSIFDTSVLKMFNDFRNWRFQMPLISGSTLTIQDNSESVLIIPTWASEEISKLIKANKNMLAWGLDFSPDADSYLICKQDNAGCFSSQIFTKSIANRKVTGASFVVIDGALKDGGEPFAINVLEDGVTIRFRSDIMESLIEALLVGRDFEQDSSAMKFSINWDDDSYSQQLVGGLVSPIDNRSLIGCYQYGLKKSRILGSSYLIPNQVHWSLRLVSVYNVAKGRFVQRVQSKVFSVSEQIVAQIATTLVPFITALIEHDLRHIFFRIRVTSEDAEYKTHPWPGMEKEFAAWLDFLDYQIAPGLFTVCSYVTVGFHAELHMALISVRPNP
ncbi:FYVE zinc finger family protein [Loa loa]|uniref:FYVE zinc finger family protein n=1 Tax=Loa loa TaxID=7209 RepID=A0A1S0UEF3_LOALO|nr:FYVE zinc finger family protein [Loa loa]EJD74052.1 FYVE zinc finger family protein [Loa loa]